MLVIAHLMAHSSKAKHDEQKQKLRKQLIENIAEQIKLENEALTGVGNDQEKTQEKEIAKLEKEISVLEQENKKISNILNSIQTETGKVKQELKEKERDIDMMEMKEKNTHDANTVLENKISEETEKFRAETRELTLMKGSLRQIESDNQNLNMKIDQLDLKIEKESKNLENLESQILEDESNRENLDTEISEKEKEIERLKVEIDSVKRKLGGIQRAYDKLEFMDSKEKYDALIDTTEISKEVTETKLKLSTLQQNFNKQSSTISTIESDISNLEKSFESSTEKKSSLERQLQQIKTRSKVIADFYTDRDLKFHTRLGVENQARSFSENELQAMEQKEQLKKDEIEEYRKQIFELKEQISKQDREHAERLQTLKRAEHADWILHKEMEKELRMKRFELEQMKEKISELEEQVIVVRNAACLGAPSSKPTLADVYLDDPSLAGLDLSTAPKPPTPPNVSGQYM